MRTGGPGSLRDRAELAAHPVHAGASHGHVLPTPVPEAQNGLPGSGVSEPSSARAKPRTAFCPSRGSFVSTYTNLRTLDEVADEAPTASCSCGAEHAPANTRNQESVAAPRIPFRLFMSSPGVRRAHARRRRPTQQQRTCPYARGSPPTQRFSALSTIPPRPARAPATPGPAPAQVRREGGYAGGLTRGGFELDDWAMTSALVPCPRCDCHAKPTEVTCPSCGEPLRREDGSVPRSAVALLLGLTAAGALASSCGSGSTPAIFYGPALTTTTSTASSGGTGGSSTSTASSGGSGGSSTGGGDAGSGDGG
jgi:hypothetical protein